MEAGLDARVRAASLLTFMWLGEELVGVAGLKHPSERRRGEVEAGSGVPRPPAEIPLELGWVYVSPKHRGGKSMSLCAPVVEAAGAGDAFATSRANNAPMHRTLAKLGFQRRGQAWTSGLNPSMLALFVRNVR